MGQSGAFAAHDIGTLRDCLSVTFAYTLVSHSSMPEDFLKHTFNADAQLYHSARPRYPEELFDALIETTRLAREAKMLEIGPGTGQATESLARRGYSITAIELGSNLARITGEILKPYPRVEVINGAFEDVELPSEFFDLVYAATAFHWLKPEAQFAKPFRILKAFGHLAIIDTRHVSDEMGDDFFFASRPIYEKYTPDYDPTFRLPLLVDLQPFELNTELFELILFKPFRMVLPYTGREYANLLNTYSVQAALEPDKRQAFLQAIREIIHSQFDDTIQHHFAMALTVARKRL